MKMFYITAMFCERPVVLCKEASVERYGYDGADLEVSVQFESQKDIETYNHEVVLLTAAQVESVMMFQKSDSFRDDKTIVLGNYGGKWRDAFKYVDSFEVKEVTINF